MRKHTQITILLLLITSVTASFSARETAAEDLSAGTVSITVEPGRHWKHTLMKVMKLYPIKTTPQIAVWLEDEAGALIETLYVTRKYAKQSWRKTPGEKIPDGGIERRESLPYWSHKHGSATGGVQTVPDKDRPLPDSVTGASPKGRFTVERRIEGLPKTFRVLVEVNNSADFNEYYSWEAGPDDPGYSGGTFGSGQPSLVYAAMIEAGMNGERIRLQPLGHASPDGSDGSLTYDLARISTALEIAGKINVIVQ